MTKLMVAERGKASVAVATEKRTRLVTTSGVVLGGDKVFWRGAHHRLFKVNSLLSAGVLKHCSAETEAGVACAHNHKGAVRWSLLGAFAKEVVVGYEGRLGLLALLLDKAMDGGYLSKASYSVILGRVPAAQEKKLIELLRTFNNNFPGHAVQGVVGAALATVKENLDGC